MGSVLQEQEGISIFRDSAALTFVGPKIRNSQPLRMNVERFFVGGAFGAEF
jgi:hypothetical protein